MSEQALNGRKGTGEKVYPWQPAIYYLLKMSETEDKEPPYRCLPTMDEKVLQIKAERVAKFLSERLAEQSDAHSEAHEKLRGALLKLQWASCDGCQGHGYCPECAAKERYWDDNGERVEGTHEEDCSIGKLITLLREGDWPLESGKKTEEQGWI